MGRTSTARERLLDAACQLMLARGYARIGVAEICARAEVRKGSFYHFFESKQALTLAVIDAHWAAQRGDWLAAADGPAPALERLERLFAQQAMSQRAMRELDGAVHGCLLANLALELSSDDTDIKAHLEKIFDEQVTLIQTALAQAAASGRIPAASAGRDTARALVAQLEGMVLFAKLRNDATVLDDLWHHASRLLTSP